MRHLARALLACSSLVATPVVASPPAHAATGAVTLIGGFVFPANSYGSASGTGSFWAVGSATGPVSATFTYSHPSATCPVTEQIDGEFRGAFNAHFYWTRMGALALVTVTGDITGTGFGEVVLPTPYWQMCPGPSVETAMIELVGT
jgi:hypothetical protein